MSDFFSCCSVECHGGVLSGVGAATEDMTPTKRAVLDLWEGAKNKVRNWTIPTIPTALPPLENVDLGSLEIRQKAPSRVARKPYPTIQPRVPHGATVGKQDQTLHGDRDRILPSEVERDSNYGQMEGPEWLELQIKPHVGR